MADSKVTALTENTTPAATDIIYIVDDPGGTPASQKVTLANIKALVNDITTDAEWDAKGDLVAGTGANTADRLAVGANNTVLMADSGEATGLKWSASPIVVDAVWDAKGDLVAGTAANTAAKLTVGANGTVLTAASGEATGLSWSTPTTVATDAVWDAAGDLVQGTGSNAAARLAIGSAYQILRVNAGATAAEWASAGRVLINEATPTGTTVTWDSIPATFNHLEIEYVARTDKASVTNEGLRFYFNSDTTTTNYLRALLSATDTTVAAADAESIIALLATAANAQAGDAAYAKISVPYYAKTTFNKKAIIFQSRREDADTEYLANFILNWESTTAITRIDIVTDTSGNFIAGSTFRLYGVF